MSQQENGQVSLIHGNPRTVAADKNYGVHRFQSIHVTCVR
jgi:hypothetical protein